MNNIITISRQFSSGGREIGKRLADSLLYAYYDAEIIKKVAEESGFCESYIEKYSEANITRGYNYTFGQTFSTLSPSDQVQIAQAKVIRELSTKGDCVIVGRCADYILKDSNNFKVFIYSSDMEQRIKRCYEKVPADKNKTAKEMQKMIKAIDKTRSKNYNYYTGQDWEDMTNYNLCIDTSVVSIKQAVATILACCNNK